MLAGWLVLPVHAADEAERGWYDDAWSYRKKITFNSEFVGSDLGKFPVLVQLDDAGVYDHAKEDGSDLRFTESDGVTRIPHELESNTDVWVRLTKLYANTDTSIYVYYGNPDADDDQDSGSVWNNRYTAVYHLNQDPDGVNRNSVGDRLHLDDNQGAVRHNRPGKIDQAVHMPNDNSWLGATDHRDRFLSQSTGTVSAFFNADSTQQYTTGRIFIDWQSRVSISLDTNAGNLLFQNYDADGAYDTISAPYEANRWHHAVWRHGDGQLAAYLDGASLGQVASGNTDDTNADFGIAPGWLLHGQVDEIRVSDVARSGDWIKAEYISQCQCEDFVTISSEPETGDGVAAGETISTDTSAIAATGGTTQTVASPLESINNLFRIVNEREITFTEWSYWSQRVIAGEKPTLPELFGAMQYQALEN